MPSNPYSQTPSPFIGVDMMYWAAMTAETVDALPAYDTPYRLPGLVSVAFAANSQSGTYYADNIAYASAVQLGDMTVTVQNADVPPETYAKWLGMEYDGGVMNLGQLNPIFIGFMYRVKKAISTHPNGNYRYFRFFKLKPAMPDVSASTQTNSIAFQDGTITMPTSMRMFDKKFGVRVDDDDPNLPEGVTPEVIEANFFKDMLWLPGGTEIGG